MTKIRNERDTQTKNNDKLKMLYNCRMCKVVLYNIALDRDLIQRYQLCFSEKKTVNLKHSSAYINTYKNSSNVWMSKKNVQENDEANCLRNHSKKLTRKINKEYKNVEFLDDISYNHRTVQSEEAQIKQLKHDISVELFSSNNRISNASLHTRSNCVQKKITSMNNKKHSSNKRLSVLKESKFRHKRKLQFNKSDTSTDSMKFSSDDDSYLDRKNLTATECKMQETSSESIDTCNNNLHSINVVNETVCNVKSECEENASSKGISGDIKTDLKTKNTNFSNKLLTIYDTINRTQDQKDVKKSDKFTTLGKDSIQATSILKPFSINIIPITVTKISDVNETNNKIIKTLPEITGNILSKDKKIQVMKINTSDESLQSSVSNDNNNNSTKQVSYIDDTFESTNILTEKEYQTPKINKSINILKTSESTSAFNNTINLKNKSTNNNKHYSLKINKNVDSLMKIKNNIRNNINDTDNITTEVYDKCILNLKQLNRSNNEKSENNISQGDKKFNEINSENILNKITSDLVNISESCNVNKSLILVNKEEVAKQNLKRTAEKNIMQLDNKRKKLNRTFLQQNNVTRNKSLNSQEFNNFSNIHTMAIKSNISEKNVPVRKIDLCKNLNTKKSNSPKLSKLENEFNNKNNVESEQIDLNNENDGIIPLNTVRNKEFRKRFFFEKESIFNKTLYKEKDIQTDPICNNCIHNTLQSTLEETQCLSQIDKGIHENTNIQEECTNEDDDCISLFAESFDTNSCDTFLYKQDKLSKSLHSDEPYIMTASSFNKYVKQNATEFNKEYAKYTKDDIEMSDKTNKKVFNIQSKQIMHTDHIPETRTISKVTLKTKNVEIPKCQLSKINLKNFYSGYCFMLLRKGTCYKKQECRYKHELQDLLNVICSQDPKAILDIMQDALYLGYNFFCRTIYITSLEKLTIEQILTMYQIFHKQAMIMFSRTQITQNTIMELSKRQLSLEMIVNHLVEYIPIKDSNNLVNILECIEKYIKRGEYWNTVRTLILRLPPDKHIVEKVLRDCIENEKLINVQDINDNLISKVPPMIMSLLDKNILDRFKNLLIEKTANNSHSTILNFGESLPETIVSPDESMNLSQIESPERDSTFINKSKNLRNNDTEVNDEIYIMQPIDDLPEVQSVYRDHLWKFYVDLDRFKKGLLHYDYNYVIEILKNYAEKQDESPLFVQSCCNILRTEVKRSEYHLRNIIRRTVQMGTFDFLSKILFDIGLDILISLVDNEAWRLALDLIQLFNIYDLPCNAEYFLLSAEIYLANKKTIKACDLLKCKNIIHTSRDKWFVKSTVNDERIRNKIIYILLDSFCNEFIEHAFFLFQFLLKDQSSQYYPIDLSRYVDKLIILSLSKKDTNLITEMANLILKYTFALSTITCRALISALIHMDENLARQIYNYAEGIGIYSAMKLWPTTYIVMNTDLTEEEIYLTFLQLLKNILINFGHAIEFAKPHQIKVYLILEIKSISKQFHCMELQNYNNNKAIMNTKSLIKNVLKHRFDPPILLSRGKGRICKLQSKSIVNYLKTEHCN